MATKPPVDLKGKRFGKLVVTGYVRDENEYIRRWFFTCRCDCGAFTRNVPLYQLTRGKHNSCGCLKTLRGPHNARFRGFGQVPGAAIRGIRGRAKRCGFSASITDKQIGDSFDKAQGKCALTGLPIWFSHQRSGGETTASIDRVDPDIGYEAGNVQWVHKDVNRMKMDFKEERFFELCRLVARAHP